MFWIRTFFFKKNYGLSSIDIVGNEYFNIIIFLTLTNYAILSLDEFFFFKYFKFDKLLSMNFNNDNIIIVIINVTVKA